MIIELDDNETDLLVEIVKAGIGGYDIAKGRRKEAKWLLHRITAHVAVRTELRSAADRLKTSGVNTGNTQQLAGGACVSIHAFETDSGGAVHCIHCGHRPQ